MKTNITLKLDADLLREARVLAAEEGRSISSLLTDRLEAIVRERKAFDKARRRALARLRQGLDLQWTPPKSRETRAGVVSTQVLQELAVNLRRKAKKSLDAKATRDVVSDYLTWQIVVNGGDSILEALDLEAKYQISFWDALIVQAAHVSGAEVLYSEDLSDGQAYGAVRVINPFRAGA